jgi:hypothetical protein
MERERENGGCEQGEGPVLGAVVVDKLAKHGDPLVVLGRPKKEGSRGAAVATGLVAETKGARSPELAFSKDA